VRLYQKIGCDKGLSPVYSLGKRDDAQSGPLPPVLFDVRVMRRVVLALHTGVSINVVMPVPWALARLFPTLITVLVMMRRDLSSLHPGNKPGTGIKLETVSKSNTGGERRLQTPVTNQGETHKTGENKPPFSPLFLPLFLCYSCTFSPLSALPYRIIVGFEQNCPGLINLGITRNNGNNHCSERVISYHRGLYGVSRRFIPGITVNNQE